MLTASEKELPNKQIYFIQNIPFFTIASVMIERIEVESVEHKTQIDFQQNKCKMANFLNLS